MGCRQRGKDPELGEFLLVETVVKPSERNGQVKEELKSRDINSVVNRHGVIHGWRDLAGIDQSDISSLARVMKQECLPHF